VKQSTKLSADARRSATRGARSAPQAPHL